MAGIDIYGSKGLSRADYRNDLAKLEGFCAIESDWKELFRWVVSAGGLLLKDKTGDNIPLDLWQNHILTVLVEIIQKDVQSYRESFIRGRGTSKQSYYAKDMQEKIKGWIKRIDCYLLFTHRDEMSTERNTAIQAAGLIKTQLQESLEYKTPHETNLQMEVENMPYYRMLEAVHEIKEKHASYIQMIEDSGDMDASLALLLTIIRHYCSIIREFNDRLSSLPAFYRKEILGATARPVRQDTALVVATPANDSAEFILPAGTGFSAGIKADGTELLYATAKSESVSGMRLESVNMFFPTRNKSGDTVASNEAVDFSNPSTFTPLFPATGEEPSAAVYGWAIESPILLLKEGVRNINLFFRLTETTAAILKRNVRGIDWKESVFDLQVSSSDGWIIREKVPVSFRESEEECGLEFSFRINKGEPAVTACNDEVHHIVTDYPVLYILARYINPLYEWMEPAEFNAVRIAVEVEGSRSVSLSNEFGEIDISQPFYPFGTQAEAGANFTFGCEELCHKAWTEVTLKGLWSKLPMTPYGYTDIYKDYPDIQTITNNSFLIDTEWQEDGKWNKCPGTPSLLFDSPGGKPAEEAAITFCRRHEDSPADILGDCTGFFRARLVAPSFGFGMEVYRRLFAEVMIYNSRHKESKQKAVPTMPVIPVLSEAGLSYKAVSVADYRGMGNIRLSHISFSKNGAAVDFSGQGSLRFISESLTGRSLHFAFRHAVGRQHIRMYVDLAVSEADTSLARGETQSIPVYTWEYYSAQNGKWNSLAQKNIIEEGTCGLTQNGYIAIELSEPIPEEWLDSGLFFRLRAKAVSGYGQCLPIRSIYTNCMPVIARNGDGRALSPGTIQKMSVEDGRIAAIVQPFSGFGGCEAETEAYSLIRQTPRIKHRNRAVSPKDYEQMVLESFPDIEKVYCFPQGSDSGGTSVHVIVLSSSEDSPYPFVPAIQLAEIKKYLARHASPFAGIQVSNPIYQSVKVECEIIVRSDIQDEGAIIRRMTRRIKRYFAGWIDLKLLPEPGWVYSYKELHAMLVNDEDIKKMVKLAIDGKSLLNTDVDVEDLEIKGTTPWHIFIPDIEIRTFPPAAGLGQAKMGINFSIK